MNKVSVLQINVPAGNSPLRDGLVKRKPELASCSAQEHVTYTVDMVVEPCADEKWKKVHNAIRTADMEAIAYTRGRNG